MSRARNGRGEHRRVGGDTRSRERDQEQATEAVSHCVQSWSRRSSLSSFVPRLDRRLEPLEIRVLKLRAAAQLLVITFVEPVETNRVENLPKWLPVAKDPDERSFFGRAVNLERQSQEILRCGSYQETD
jgi:hypothetical protein